MRLLDVRTGLYRDSVRLMQISAVLAELPGVEKVLVAMATGANLDLLAAMGFVEPIEAGPDDLLVALVAADDAAMAATLDRLEVELADTGAPGPPRTDPSAPPRTTGSAIASLAAGGAGPTIAVVSTPGRYAFVEAMDALDAGASVLVFSDNVPVAQEIALKRAAVQRGLLVMGPDCGTAVIGGVGLGFANVVRPGPVGLVAASGTGAQQVMSLLAWAGVGISHCLGVGGRDLTEPVGGVSTHTALDLLDADPATELIVLVAKPAAAGVGDEVHEHIARLRTPVVSAVLDPAEPDLTATVETILQRLDVGVPVWPHWSIAAPVAARPGGGLRGLFSGGTLCVEALAIAAAGLGSVSSNLALGPQWRVDAGGAAHVLIDLGSDEFTLGRPHPMIDPWPRLERFTLEASDPTCGVLLLDVVLGHGAHPDPAADLAAAVRAAKRTRPELAVVVSLIGTADDPQDLYRQADTLSAAGADVFTSNAQAARFAVAAAAGGSP
jgi:FdrA protein